MRWKHEAAICVGSCVHPIKIQPNAYLWGWVLVVRVTFVKSHRICNEILMG